MADSVNHTRGPWQYRPKENDDWGFVRSADGWLVAVAKDSSVPFEAYGAYRERKEDPFEANARLIAAAPDLLEACRLLIGADGEGVKFSERVNKALHAIARAEGRS